MGTTVVGLIHQVAITASATHIVYLSPIGRNATSIVYSSLSNFISPNSQVSHA